MLNDALQSVWSEALAPRYEVAIRHVMYRDEGTNLGQDSGFWAEI